MILVHSTRFLEVANIDTPFKIFICISQAYKNHALYALERWLTKYQILHPRGPILGYCSGHPVYSRTCVQTLKPRQRWLREGLQVKGNEIPVKVCLI